MSVDKLVDSTQLDSDLTSVANAIRTKGGTSAQLAFPADFISAINAISGGGGTGLKYDKGTFTLANDTNGNPNVLISHNLGEVPKIVIVWTEDYSTGTPPSADLNAGYIYLDKIVDMQQQFSTSQFGDYPLFVWLYMYSTGKIQASPPGSTSYAPGSGFASSTGFYLIRRGNTNYWRAGVTYKYFVAEKFWT